MCCQDYRPGMTRADLEDEQRQQRIRDGLDPDPDSTAKASRRSSGAADDGSFSRPGIYLMTSSHHGSPQEGPSSEEPDMMCPSKHPTTWCFTSIGRNGKRRQRFKDSPILRDDT